MELVTKLINALAKAEIKFVLETGPEEVCDPCISLLDHKDYHIQVLEPGAYGTAISGFQINEILYEEGGITSINMPEEWSFKANEIDKVINFIKAL